MNKFRTVFLSLLLALCASSVYAQGKSIILTSPAEYQVLAISPNGKWACGVYQDYSYSNYGFLWNLQTGDIQLLSTSSESHAYSVSDDGVVSGQFADASSSETGVAVPLPGYYKDGRWHSVELPKGMNVLEGDGYGITPDGHYMSGYLCTKKLNPNTGRKVDAYLPFIWKDGKIYKQLSENTAMIYAISPDGQSAAGWEEGPVHHNRIPTYWAADGTKKYLTNSEGPWCSARKFTPDGKKILFWGGWDEEKSTNDENADWLYCIYDIETGEVTEYPTFTSGQGFDVYDISDNYTIVGEMGDGSYINVAGKGYDAKEYLESLGVDFSGYDIFLIANASAISADDKVISLTYYDNEYAPRSMIVMPNRELEELAPVCLTASQLDGVQSVALTWADAVGSKTITGYNVYRGDTKVNAELLKEAKYYDANLAYGTYGYTVSAVYESGAEKKSESVSVTVAPKEISKPQALFVRQKGVNGSYLEWEVPATNLVAKSYVDLSNVNMSAFGVNAAAGLSGFETAIRVSAEEMACYAGCKLTQVSFYPMSEQKGWTINVYTRDAEGKLQKIASQKVVQKLDYRHRNTVKLDNPVALPAGELIIGIQVDLGNTTSEVIGMDMGTLNAGNGDLLRQVTEDDFYSLYEASVATGYPYITSWMIDAVFAPEGADQNADEISHYNVYNDNKKVGETKNLNFEVSDLSEGTHNIGVDAAYANGKVSAVVAKELDVKPRFEAVKPANVAYANATKIYAEWKAPVDEDKTEISYASGEPQAIAPKAPSGYNLMAAAVYTPSMLKGYNGYEIKSFKFYPKADAVFTFYLIENETTVCELEVEDYKLNEWNTVELPTPLTVDATATYQLALDCFDAGTDAPLAIDATVPNLFYSDLYSTDEGQNWASLSDTGLNGNWMMGFDIVQSDAKTLNVDGYDVVIDGAKKNTDKVKATNFVYDFGTEDAKQHSIRVDVYYPAKAESVEGGVTYFRIGTTGIDNVGVATINIRKGENLLKVDGEGVKSIEAYSANGMKVAEADGNVMNLAGFANGVYVIKVNTVNGTVNRKINIVK